MHKADAICVIVGTRPGIIKMSPIIRELRMQAMPFVVVHTGQHYSFDMDRQFFEALELSPPQFRLDAVTEGMSHGRQTATMLVGVEDALMETNPRVVLVGGDANTNLAGALAARKLQLQLAHVEAGLRSYDWRMPEEHNRVMIDHISDFLFPPTDDARRNLIDERVRGQVILTGNTVVDALEQNYELALEKSDVLSRSGLEPQRYVIATVHREENVDISPRMKDVVDAILLVADELQLPIVFPVHPRTRKRLEEFSLWDKLVANRLVRVLSPAGYLDFLRLLGSAAVVLTDSGGIQEEACILQVPCVTMRDSTERPESVSVGSNVVAGLHPETVVEHAAKALASPRGWANPFGDGKAAERIVAALASEKPMGCRR